ncbi:kinesin-related protein 4 [Artemisia annua]|uniref:Kinesin-related protein 4 n=1 Tax=Artemisia annua TaxID=35608 RepID=A0A2U1KE96_ARTAN|nr:kinesin-related protein 4 [Artemisia annua]
MWFPLIILQGTIPEGLMPNELQNTSRRMIVLQEKVSKIVQGQSSVMVYNRNQLQLFLVLYHAATTPFSCLFILLYGGFLLLFPYDREKRGSVNYEIPREIRKIEEMAWYADGETFMRNEFTSSIAYAYGNVTLC